MKTIIKKFPSSIYKKFPVNKDYCKSLKNILQEVSNNIASLSSLFPCGADCTIYGTVGPKIACRRRPMITEGAGHFFPPFIGH